ncbi:MAG: pilus assembly protein PilN [Gammaproteobacteria bacterium]|jgi:type IV pilus assembly protein PilN|nr:pilus assembly protein PilN [Gammaproteobacteria bacterium]|tara:strand:+ start:254 stop:820 length:567 start_codon:yes stop_codon:yes gene_type:complete
MADIKINLLPWRADLREQKKKEFLNVLVGVLLIAGLIVGGFDRFYNREIDNQTGRNNFLTGEIKLLETRIEEIKLLQQTRNELLARMEVIQNLQGNRPIIVRLFDELARQLAPRVFFTDLRLVGKELSIRGVAESNNRISSQLRNLSESTWFDKPNVTAINADSNYGPQSSQFALSVVQSTPKKEEPN